MLKEGKSYIKHIDSSFLMRYKANFTPTTDFGQLSSTDCIIICVPTPLDEYRQPDMGYVFSTAETTSKILRKGQLIILESTTDPGTTDEDLRIILEKFGLKAGEEFLPCLFA